MSTTLTKPAYTMRPLATLVGWYEIVRSDGVVVGAMQGRAEAAARVRRLNKQQR
jgi:hypothetical protein